MYSSLIICVHYVQNIPPVSVCHFSSSLNSRWIPFPHSEPLKCHADATCQLVLKKKRKRRKNPQNKSPKLKGMVWLKKMSLLCMNGAAFLYSLFVVSFWVPWSGTQCQKTSLFYLSSSQALKQLHLLCLRWCNPMHSSINSLGKCNCPHSSVKQCKECYWTGH